MAFPTLRRLFHEEDSLCNRWHIHGEKAVAFAARMASLEKVPLSICTVNMMSGGIRGPAVYAHSDREISKLLTDAVAMARSAGAEDVSAIELDAREVADAIVAYANREGFDHIVTGTGDPRGVKRLVLGSVAATVAASADCAVTVAR
jgi:nucleotide-binding universal stress UspA family protein